MLGILLCYENESVTLISPIKAYITIETSLPDSLKSACVLYILCARMRLDIRTGLDASISHTQKSIKVHLLGLTKFPDFSLTIFCFSLTTKHITDDLLLPQQ